METNEKLSIAENNRRTATHSGTPEVISTREQAVHALRQAEAKYRGIFENAVEGIFQTTPSGHYLSANPALARIYGYESPDQLMRSIGDIERQLYVIPSRRDDFVRLMERDGVVTGFESEIYRKDRSVIWISENARAVRNLLGEIEYYEGTVVDISSRKQSEQLHREKEAAEAANRAKSQFLAHMSHELRTPLNGVIGMLDLLHETSLSDQQQRYASIARSSADLLLGLINQILDLSKIEAGKLELDEVDFELRPLIEAALEMLGSKARQKGLELTLNMPPELSVRALGDARRLQQVIVNLLSNAVKFTARGQVQVRVTKVSETDDGIVIRLAVEDTGIGIPEDRLNRLFRPFSQVDASTTRQFGGTGLGLAISKEIIELMGGAIGVRSQLNSGSVFWFRLPLRKHQHEAAPICATPPNLQGLRILAVDDNPTNREILFRQLSAWRFRVELAPDGFTALAMLHRAAETNKQFALALLDGDMPGIDGYELARRIHDDRQLQSTQLLMLTSLAAQPSDFDPHAVGIAGCLTKPVRQSQLFDALMVTASRHQVLQAETAGGGENNSANQDTSKNGSQDSRHSAASIVPRQSDLRSTAVQQRRNGVRLLLAEDNEINQMVTLEILSMAGFQCDVSQNGRDAIQKVRSQQYDLVLMDCQMPEMDGLAATREIRRLEAHGELPQHRGRLPIIALTANAIEGDRETCLAAGMDEYLSKPLDSIKLVDLLDTLLSSVTDIPANSDSGSNRCDTPKQADIGNNIPPPINLPELNQRCSGNTDFIQRMLVKLADRLPGDLAQLNTCVSQERLHEAATLAHSLKGAAANLSAADLRQATAALEMACRNSDQAAAQQCLDSLNSAVSACLEFINGAAVSANSCH
jgi:PAS domain S-box-containing protein